MKGGPRVTEYTVSRNPQVFKRDRAEGELPTELDGDTIDRT